MAGITQQLIEKERLRQEHNIELIASENFVSEAVMRAVGSCLTNKYAEGYPYKRLTGNVGRYYGGTEHVDAIEEHCCNQFRYLFKTDMHVNVQPHSGSAANMAAFMTLLGPRDPVLSMRLSSGGHLSHGTSMNFSGKFYSNYHYDVDHTGYIDYDKVERLAKSLRPKLIIAGASAYSRTIDFEFFAWLAEKVGAFFMADIAHIAGLVATGHHPSPFGYADIITTTTHKTLRGPRGGVVFCKPGMAKKLDSTVFPGIQGGPLMHVIAGKAVCAEEAMEPEFTRYIHDVVENSSAMANRFIELGYKVVSGGTDNHMFLLDLSDLDISGKEAQDILDSHGITLNKNAIPNDPRPPKETSGVRIGTAAMTTKGFTKQNFVEVANIIDTILRGAQHDNHPGRP